MNSRTLNADIRSFACPDQQDIAEWQALSREDQVRSLRRLAEHPEADAVCPHSLDAIIEQARAHTS